MHAQGNDDLISEGQMRATSYDFDKEITEKRPSESEVAKLPSVIKDTDK